MAISFLLFEAMSQEIAEHGVLYQAMFSALILISLMACPL